jgi:predicted secreted acid phosphatase
MTTVPGINQVLQQSTIAQELSQQAQSPKPSPDQAAAIQQAQQAVQNSVIQGSEESERLKRQKEKKGERQAGKLKNKKRGRDEDLALDPDATGRILDTTA